VIIQLAITIATLTTQHPITELVIDYTTIEYVEGQRMVCRDAQLLGWGVGEATVRASGCVADIIYVNGFEGKL
jgi:hypothetical protein